MKQKKIDRVLKEFALNGCKNLEFKKPGHVWEQSITSKADLIENTGPSYNFKYRIKPEYLKQLIINEFNKNGKVNIEYKNTNIPNAAWYPTSADKVEQLTILMNNGYKYRIRKETTKPCKDKLPIPMLDGEEINYLESKMFTGKFWIAAPGLYFNTKEEADAYVQYLKSLPQVSN